MQYTKNIKTFILSSRPTISVSSTVLGQLPPKKIAPQLQKLTLTQTLTLTRGQSSSACPTNPKTYLNLDPTPNANQGTIFLGWGGGDNCPEDIFRPGHQFVLLGEYEYAKNYIVLLQFFCRFMSSMKLFFPLRFDVSLLQFQN